jgi:hypothetical protein
VDRSAGVSGIFGSQIIPPGDLHVVDLVKAWKEEIFEVAGLKTKEKL